MRIVFYVQFFPPVAFGGSEFQFFQYAKELARRGHDVHVITQRVLQRRVSEDISGVKVHRVGLPVVYAGTQTRLFPESFSYIVHGILEGVRIARKARVDLIHSNTYLPVISGHSCSKLARIPHIMTIHDVFTTTDGAFMRKWAAQQSLSSHFAGFGRMVEKILLHLSVEAVHTVSNTTKTDIQQLSPECGRVVTIPNGIPIEDYRIGEASQPRNQAVYVGRLVFYKNIETVILAWPAVLRRDPTARLVIVGDGPMKGHLQDLVRTSGISASVHFLGWVEHRRKVEVIKSSAVLILPSVYEGFGIVILESFACSRPVVVSNVAPLNQLVKDGVDGFAVNPYEPSEWANRISILLGSPGLCQEMGIHGYSKVSASYTIEKVVDSLENLYASIRSDPQQLRK